jgi:hypothetical protein
LEKEQVNEGDARKYAKEVGAIFKLTSACTAAGIEELFRSVGCKILNPNYSDDDESPSKSPGGGQQQVVQQQPVEKDSGKIKLNNQKPDKKKEKKGFC